MRPIRLKLPGTTKPDESAKRLLAWQLTQLGEVFHVEHPFSQELGRKHRWDVAFLPELLAVEVNGGVWTRGAHGHPTTIIRNMEKTNLGAKLGWLILAFTPQQVKSGEALNFILEVLTILRSPYVAKTSDR